MAWFCRCFITRKNNDYISHNAFFNHIMDCYSNHADSNSRRLKYRIIHTDDCGTYCKCQQNFLTLIKNSETHQCTYMHKFAQTHGFKGAWDATSKLLQNEITRLKLKLTRVANAKDCYCHLSPIISKDNSNRIK